MSLSTVWSCPLSSLRDVIDHLPVHPGTFFRSWQLKSPEITIQSPRGTDCSRISSCSNVSCAKGDSFLYLCGTYTTMKNIGQMGPCSRTHAILVPMQLESCIFVFILGESMMATPPAGSQHFPCSFKSARSDEIHIAESSIIFCLLRNSVRPRTSLPNDLQNSFLDLL